MTALHPGAVSRRRGWSWATARWASASSSASMVKFVDGQADVLVSTAIVESGLDIPASNTIIINRADRFGLAQLYQLRGRVGRERQQAYAYLLVPADGRRRRDGAAAAAGDRGDDRAGRGLPARHAGPRDPRLRQPARGGPARPHRRRRLRSLHEAPGGGRARIEGRAGGRARRPGDLGGRRSAPARGVRARGEPAPRALQAAGRDRAAPTRSRRCAPSSPIASARRRPRSRRCWTWWGCASRRAALGVERIEAGGGRAVLTFAPSTPVTPERILERHRGRAAARMSSRRSTRWRRGSPRSRGRRFATPSARSWSRCA